MKSIIELLYRLKRWIIKFYKKYFTVENPESSLLPDRIFIKKLYEQRIGKKLNLKNPVTFTEKLNWLKLYDRKDEYTVMVDKYKAREYVAQRIGSEYLVPLAGVWDSPDEIDFDSLPDKFVLKCNHNSDVIICTDKSSFDFEGAKKKLAEQLGQDYYKHKREWSYKNVPRKIICEKFMENTDGSPLVDYKLFCFNGKVKFIMVNSSRFDDGGVKSDMYDTNWVHMDMQDGHYPMAGDIFEKPVCFEEMCSLAEVLSENKPELRVDFNFWNGKLYFGELTVYHSAGMECFQPEKWDYTLGEWLELPKKKG